MNFLALVILPLSQMSMLTPEVFAKYANEQPSVRVLTPQMSRALMEESRLAFAPYRWRRFIMRLTGRYMWYDERLLLWLLQRAYLRFLPFPYPSISTVEDWKYQARTMAEQPVTVPRHIGLAFERNAFTAQNLLEMSRFRDRVGWRFAFMEDSVLSGLMALKALAPG